MSAPTRLAGFALILAVTFGGGVALGAAFGPEDTAIPAPAPAPVQDGRPELTATTTAPAHPASSHAAGHGS